MSHHTRLSAGVKSLICFLCLAFMLMLCFIYFSIYSLQLESYDDLSGYFRYSLNYHDHFIYLKTIERLEDDGINYEFNNDFGISVIYILLAKLFPGDVKDDFVLLSFLFNCLILIFSAHLYFKICDQLNLGLGAKLTFFANLFFLYFAQLINKDLLTVCAFLITLYCGLTGRLYTLLLLLPILLLIRQQLAVFLVVYIFLMQGHKPYWRMVVVYLSSSIFAAYLSSHLDIIGDESMGDGFNLFLMKFNQESLLGYVIFNPLRVVQYIYEAYSSFFFFLDDGGVDTAKILRIPQLILVALMGKYIFSGFIHFNYFVNTKAKPILILIVAYLIAWLMNPTINARYVMVVTPILVLLALYVRNQGRKI